MKCVPICFGIDVKDDFPIFFGAFYKFAHYCALNGWPIIAQEEYFEKPTYYEKKFPIDLKKIANINEIPNINKIDFDKIDKYSISLEETNKVLSNYKNKDEAWVQIMTEYDDTLFKILDKRISKIVKKYQDLKYIVVWRHNETITKLAKKYNLEMLEMELSGVRKPSYNLGLCYFVHSNKYSRDELDERYEKFIKDIKGKKLPLLSRNDLISLMVSENELNNMFKEEDHEFGIALGLRNDYDTIATKSIKNEDILKQIVNYRNESNILIRKHPANWEYKYALEDKFDLDKSISSIQFLSRCHKIVSSISNLGVEAMLFGKTSYTLGNMPFSRFCYTDLDFNDEYVISVQDLNFLLFCFFVPYSIALTQEYIDFRAKTKNEYEIYMYHYNYIMKHLKNKKNKEYVLSNNYNYGITKRKQMEERINNFDQEIKKVIDEKNAIQAERDSMLNSRSWKITKPLRRLKRKR